MVTPTLSCSLWTFLCRPGMGTPASCWCRPSPRLSAHGSATRGSRWHQTYWHSNPGRMNREQVSPVELRPPSSLTGGFFFLFMIHPGRKASMPICLSTISLAFFSCAVGWMWATSCSQGNDEDVSLPYGSCQLILASALEPSRGPTPPLLRIEASIRAPQRSSASF